ncbi:MAG: hypothetical protein IJ338_08395 [Bacteroidaceae bacterium]|nr:hypothetical protein [Bacteroidaceae bacterium]
MDILIIGTLLVVGIFLIILEIFFLPGITIAGIASILFLAGAIYYAFAELGSTEGFVVLAVSVMAVITAIIWFMRSKTLTKMSLHTEIDSVAPTLIDSHIKVGDTGVTLSRLNPMGQIIIGNEKIEAKSLDGFIDENQPVVVEKVENTNVIVRLK